MEKTDHDAQGTRGTNKGRIKFETLIHPINIDGPVRGFVVPRRLSIKGKSCRKRTGLLIAISSFGFAEAQRGTGSDRITARYASGPPS